MQVVVDASIPVKAGFYIQVLHLKSQAGYVVFYQDDQWLPRYSCYPGRIVHAAEWSDSVLWSLYVGVHVGIIGLYAEFFIIFVTQHTHTQIPEECIRTTFYFT